MSYYNSPLANTPKRQRISSDLRKVRFVFLGLIVAFVICLVRMDLFLNFTNTSLLIEILILCGLVFGYFYYDRVKVVSYDAHHIFITGNSSETKIAISGILSLTEKEGRNYDDPHYWVLDFQDINGHIGHTKFGARMWTAAFDDFIIFLERVNPSVIHYLS